MSAGAATASLFSERWHRVSDLRPRLPVTVRVRRQVLRGEVWHLLGGAGGQTSYRVNSSGWNFVGRCDGTRSVAEIWRAIVESGAEHLPTQDEIIQLLVQLNNAELVEFERVAGLDSVLDRRRRRKSSSRRSRLNPLSFRVSLGNPGALLDRLSGLSSFLFSPLGLALWCALVLAGLQTLVANWDDAMHHGALWLQTPRYLLIAWLCYPLMKVIHEAAHAMAIRRWGGEVKEIGIGLYCLTPMPYVDASGAGLLTRRYQRCLVGAAGIFAEMGLAAIGLIAWTTLETGWVRDIAFSVALIGGVSTLFFNANPLLRLDGYFIASDALQLPNLAGRSSAWWHATIVRYGLGLSHRSAMTAQPGEKAWLIAYHPLALAYRVLTAVWLVLWAGSMHPLLGVLAGVFVVIAMFALPLGGWAARLYREVPADRRRYAARARLAAGALLVLIMVAVIPLPDRLAAQGVVWLPEEARLRADTAGFLDTILADNTPVQKNDLIASLSAIELDTELAQLTAQRVGLQTSLYQTLLEDPFKSRQVEADLKALDGQLEHVQSQRRGLSVTAASDGLIALQRPQDQPGRYVKRGDEIGHVRTSAATVIRVAIDQEDATRLAANAAPAQVRLAQFNGGTFRGRILRLEPAANDRLPSPALSTNAAGDIVTDPADKNDLKPVRPVRIVDVEVADLNQAAAGGRAWVRFDFGQASALSQLVRHAAQVVLLRFSPVES